jgi:uncharacterized membrane protein (DUF485 family)
MCQVSVTCNCRRGSSAWPMVVAILVAAFLLGPAVAALVGLAASLITAIVTAVCVSVGIVVAGWVLKGVAVAAIDEIGLRRHNRRMAAIYPHVARELGLPGPQPSTRALPAAQPRQVVDAEVIEVRRAR